ncbi:MAG: single-stranded DNA-binding protein [Cyclobacteriaceae bacterium]|nr:single-stranded DNA-binding protein [Cyclobacteriaceae bacterium]
MAGVNKVILIGNLGSDPEIRVLPNGSTVANFNIATSETYVKEGEKITQTEWHRIELWDGLARIAEQYLRKGSQVYIEGKLRTDSWTDNEGQNRSTVKIRGLNMTLLGRPADSGYSPPAASRAEPTPQSASSVQSPAPKAAPPPATGYSGDDSADDLPF